MLASLLGFGGGFGFIVVVFGEFGSGSLEWDGSEPNGFNPGLVYEREDVSFELFR